MHEHSWIKIANRGEQHFTNFLVEEIKIAYVPKMNNIKKIVKIFWCVCRISNKKSSTFKNTAVLRRVNSSLQYKDFRNLERAFIMIVDYT